MNKYREELENILKDLTANGYRCFISEEGKPDYLYGYIITPSDNVLYIQRHTYHWSGWHVSIRYVPSRKNGSGCAASEEPLQVVDVDAVVKAEQSGLAFARTLGATLYKSSADWLNAYWEKNNIVEIK